MHEILVNRLGGLSLPRKSVVGLTDRPDMSLDVYRGRKTTKTTTTTRVMEQTRKVNGRTYEQTEKRLVFDGRIRVKQLN